MVGVPEFHLKDFWFIIVPALILGAGFLILVVGLLTGTPDVPKEDSTCKDIPRKIKPMPGPPGPPEPKEDWSDG